MTAVTFTHRNLVILMFGAATACGGRPAVTVAPAPATPEATVEQFLAAAADTNLERMGDLWGTARGPSVLTIPSQERQRRLAIMQRVLRNDEHRVVASEASPTRPDRRVLRVELVRDGQRFLVPFTLVIARTGGWLINEIGLDAAIPAPSGRTSP